MLSANRFSGNIPSEIGELSKLVILYGFDIGTARSSHTASHRRLNTNSLQGSVPTELGNLKSMEIFALNNNGLTGTMPTEMGRPWGAKLTIL
jgi:hypothetical protein